MKKVCVILYISVLASAILANVPTHYYVGRIEVSESFWNLMPDSLDYISGEFYCDTLKIKSRELPLTHYIDSVSIPGTYILSKRPPEVIAELERAFSMINRNQRQKSLSVSVGELAPEIRLLKYKDKCVSDSLIVPGHCYLLSFWATWCGNCLQELKPDCIPALAETFAKDTSFHFIPICIDATAEDLNDFFNSKLGSKWSYLSEITYLDTDRKANEKFGKSGVLPLNVVIGTDGKILYIHSGSIIGTEEMSELHEIIETCLKRI